MWSCVGLCAMCLRCDSCMSLSCVSVWCEGNICRSLMCFMCSCVSLWCDVFMCETLMWSCVSLCEMWLRCASSMSLWCVSVWCDVIMCTVLCCNVITCKFLMWFMWSCVSLWCDVIICESFVICHNATREQKQERVGGRGTGGWGGRTLGIPGEFRKAPRMPLQLTNGTYHSPNHVTHRVTSGSRHTSENISPLWMPLQFVLLMSIRYTR